MGSRLTVRTPGDYLLSRDVCSYGYFLLAPNEWDPIERSHSTVLRLPGGVTRCVVTQPAGAVGSDLRLDADRRLGREERPVITGLVSRMLRLDEPADAVAAFHRADPRWAPTGRGRLFRSPTLFEDVVKTVTSCNVAWPSTIKMNEKLCAAIGDGAFPSAGELARTRPATLRARCGVGYRDARLVELAKRFSSGDVDILRLEDPETPDDEVFELLKELPGVGPYAAGNIMQLLGRYSRLAIDTETERHARDHLGFRETGRELKARIESHYARFGDQKFRSYWFELWEAYEGRRGPAWSWTRRETGPSFTASSLSRTSGR